MKRTLALCSLIILTACGGQLPIYHQSYQPPPAESCRNLDLGPGVSEYGAPIKLNEEERTWLERAKRIAPDGVEVSPRLVRLARLILELDYLGCDTQHPDLKSDLYAHVGLYSHVNQIRTQWYFSQAHPDFIRPRAERMLKRLEDTHTPLFVGLSARRSWSVGSAAHLVRYRAEIKLEPSPRLIKNQFHYRGRVLGERIAQSMYVTLPNGSVQTCSFQREDREEHPLIKCHRHPEDYQMIDAEFSCGAPGRYQIEFTGDHRARGPSPLTNFRVWCGQPPPERLSGEPLIKSREVVSVKRGEAELVKRVNQARAKAGLSTLTYDPELSEVARRYSTVRRQTKCGGHKCGGTTLRGRIHEAGLETMHVYENASNSSSPVRSHLGLMNSPAHRSATLSKEMARYGVGISVKKPKREGQAPFYYVTELYQSQLLERNAEGCKRYLKDQLMAELSGVEYSSEYATSAQTLINEYAELNEISAETRSRVQSDDKQLLFIYYGQGFKSYGYTPVKHLAKLLKQKGATKLGIGCSRSTRGHKERWFVLVRHNKSPTTRAGCEAYLTERLRVELPHLKPSTKLGELGEEITKIMSKSSKTTSQNVRRFARSKGIHYTYFKDQPGPKSIRIGKLIRSIKQWTSGEVAVTCVKSSKPNRWQVVMTYDEGATSASKCRAFLRDEVQRRFRRAKPSIKMTQVSAELVKLISSAPLDDTQRAQRVADHFEEPKRHMLWSHVERPQRVDLDAYIDMIRGDHATEFGVTCLNHAPDNPKSSDWSVVIHHNESEMSDRECEAYLTQKIVPKRTPKRTPRTPKGNQETESDRPQLKLNPRLAQVSNQIVSAMTNRALTDAEREAKIKGADQASRLHLKWYGVEPRAIPLDDLFSAVKQRDAKEFALSCAKYQEEGEDQKRWAIAIHYR